MKRFLSVVICLLLSVLMLYGAAKKDWQKARLVDVKTQDMQSDVYNNPNTAAGGPASGDSMRGPLGGSFTSAPTHFIIYNILIQSENELIWATISREASFRPPDLKIGSDVEYKLSGPKFIEVKDAAGKKYEFKVKKREKIDPAQKQ